MNEIPGIENSRLSPVTTNPKITVAAKPMSIDPATMPSINDSKTLSGGKKCSHSHDKTEA
jgi:hypothetical protein